MRSSVPTFDRSILGIPAENDEYDRGLIFLFDPSTGQPSVHSTSEESDVLVETPPYEPSRSSNNSSSRKVNTPRSLSDTASGLPPPVVTSKSEGLSDGISSDAGADQPHPHSLPSVSASGGTPSPKSPQKPADLPLVGGYPARTMSPAASSGPDPLLGVDPRRIVHLNTIDFRCLEELMSVESPSPSTTLVDTQIRHSIDPPYSESVEGSRPGYREASQRNGAHTIMVEAGQAKTRPTLRRRSTVDKVNRAKERKRVKLMREHGVCLPCLVNHEQCDLGDICAKCLRGSWKIPKTPCVRPQLSKAVLFRKGALSFPEGPNEISDFSVPRRNVPLYLYNVGSAHTTVTPESRPQLKVSCREFPETPGVCSVKSWTKGSCKVDIHLPNFAMTTRQCSETAKNLDNLVETEYERLVAELASGQDDIVTWTLAEAKRQAEKCWPIRGALELSILSRLASKSFNIYGEETLGIQREQDPECPYYQRIPIPPLLDAQLDYLLMEKMKKLKKSVLSELRRMIAGQGRKHWFKIYLIMLVLLLNLESVYQNQRRQMQRYQKRTPQQDTMLQSWEHAAQNLILHFRAVCRGHIAQNMDWSKEDQDAAAVDDKSLHFIAQLREFVVSRAGDLRKRSNATLDTPLVWISALLSPSEEV